jgi:transcriptional regulator with XRE-family HTH domain
MSDAKVRNMEEFAALSGISRPTVSKYFNDPDSVRPTTRARIEEALARYDYRPNIFAMNQNRKLTKNVGIVVPYLADPFFAEMARRLEQRCIAAGYRPTLYSAHGEKELEVDILDSLRSLKPAGVLLAPLGRASDHLEVEKFCRDVPTVLFDSNIEGMGVGLCRIGQFQLRVADGGVSDPHWYAPPAFFEMATPANPNANKRRIAYVEMMDKLGYEPNVVSVRGAGLGVRGNRPQRRAGGSDLRPAELQLCSVQQ